MQDTILQDFRKVVTPQFISGIAQKVKFNRRCTAQINGFDFVKMLLMQIGSGREVNYNNLNATLSKINPNIDISNQALSEYFYKQSSVDLFRTIYKSVLAFQKEKLLQKHNKNLDLTVLNPFKRVLVEDSTICILNRLLANRYKGSGGSASKSSLKINMIHDLNTAAMIKMTISSGNVPDASLSDSILEELLPNDLVLRDLGYFKLHVLRSIADKEAYFISRFRSDIEVYLDPESNSPIDLGKHLKKAYPNQTVDKEVYLGKEKLKVRLVAYQVPPEIANKRRRKARENARRKGKTPKERRLQILDYVILVTNIPQEMLHSEMLGTIYRMRWAIELIFKVWKSELNLQLNLKGYKATRIECVIYGTLIICLLTTLIHGWLKTAVDPLEKEISLDKLSKWLVNKEGYARLFCGAISKLKNELQRNLRKVKTQKRKRKTTFERVLSMEAYSEKYVIDF